MRNLILVGERRRKVDLKDVTTEKEGRRVTDLCQTLVGDVDPNASTFALTNDGIVVKLSPESQIEWMAELDPLCEQPGGEWFSLSFVDTGEDVALVCLSKNGAIVTVSPITGEAELVGEFEHGLQAGCFSPDGEVLCLLTFEEEDAEHGGTPGKKNSALLLMNTQWEVLAEATIESHIPSEESPDSKVSMCWRPDGFLVALSTVDVSDKMRKIRIFKRDNLQFHAIGRLEDGSGKLVPNIIASCGIHWASAGCSQVLAGAQRKSKKTLQIIFFEPNGNRHREFPLRGHGDAIEVLDLTWNVDSDLLAVALREAGCDKVQLWHRSNYHWYMKQEFRFDPQKVTRVSFHPEKSYLLYVFFENQCAWWEYEVLWRPSSIQLLAPKTCVAHVIDGCSLNMTALDQALIPPPMFAFTIAMDNPICQVITSSDESQNVVTVVRLSDGSIVLLGNPVTNTARRRYAAPSIIAKGSLKDMEDIDDTALRSLVIVEHSEAAIKLLAICGADENGMQESLRVLVISWNEESQNASMTVAAAPIKLEQRVLCCVPWSDSLTGALLELEDGSLFAYEPENDGQGSLRPLFGQEFMEPCAWIAGIKDTSPFSGGGIYQHQNYHDRKELIFGLSRRSRLFYHDMLLSDAVSSFFVSMSHGYLCFAAAAGSTSVLRFLPLSDLQNFDTFLGSDSNVIFEGYQPRSVERGARLVAILPDSPMAILQMPRGNLEGIYPRALILRFVMKKIAASEYSEAFTMMRRQKVNLNLIVDLNPRKFLEEGLAMFLKQVISIDHLNLFISCLQNWDSTQHQYIVPPWLHLISERDAAVKKTFDFSTKINQVCSKMRLLMSQAEREGSIEGGKPIAEGHFLLPILTTFAKEDPPKLEEALILIKENAIAKSEQSTAAVKKPPLFSDAAQSSIQYLAFLADHELIFNVGLGLYDFDVARACARNSQMDPKVYLPLLKRLRSLPAYYGRYEVDMRLKRYNQALRNLFKSCQENEPLEGVEPCQDEKTGLPLEVGNSFDSCMALIENHQLHNVGLELFKSDSTKKRQLMISLGDKLLKDGNASSSLTVFLATEPVDVEKAKNAARACKNWQVYFTLAFGEPTNGDSNGEDKTIAAQEIAESIAMTSEGHYNLRGDLCDAARILLDYCHDVDGAVDMLIKGWAWREGCRVAKLNNRPDLVQRCIDAAVAFAGNMLEDLEERKQTFVTKNQRYEEVLEIRKEAIRSGEAEDPQMMEDDNGSVFSAASNVSNMSLQSTASTSSHSSVISIRSSNSTTFTLTGREMDTRHLSKFGPNGAKKDKKKKKKKNKAGKKRIIPGSPEELQSLVDLLKGICVNEDLGRVISSTIEFLAHTSGMLDTARDLYQCYTAMSEEIQKCHTERAENAKSARLADISKLPITLPCEEVVDKLANAKLSDSLAEVFSLL